MSTDEKTTKDLIQTCEDGEKGFAQAADKLADDAAEVAQTFRGLGQERGAMSKELLEMAKAYGDSIKESGTATAAVHRGWMSLKDALSGSSPKGVIDAAEQGEDHAVEEYEKALEEDISPELRQVVTRQLQQVRASRDQVKALAAAHG